jgi:hypothetical protein
MRVSAFQGKPTLYLTLKRLFARLDGYQSDCKGVIPDASNPI